jgi:hypothetical protein
VSAVFVTQASVLEGYIVGGLIALAALYALWRLERDWTEKEGLSQEKNEHHTTR